MTSFAVSKQLKEDGFPQPVFEFGQFWYSSKGHLWVIARLSPEGDIRAVCMEDTRWEHLRDTNGFIYCPTEIEVVRASLEATPLAIHYAPPYDLKANEVKE